MTSQMTRFLSMLFKHLLLQGRRGRRARHLTRIWLRWGLHRIVSMLQVASEQIGFSRLVARGRRLEDPNLVEGLPHFTQHRLEFGALEDLREKTPFSIQVFARKFKRQPDQFRRPR